ncbi:hypothetical protein H310_03976 [Aphanomyces invadans]|uniref:Uncharacterized protein n=1 Tax=Aphanomyces invadans TaxID=157072 RepID=A0A024UF77_9STRA|nr:hypothetical protein H310_03976 [Aphanomyces invadans]ETW04855.1 hypothetical protein H310_03976 [Aphanomyces invadans]|eukprot:XP_008866293.1 hypothetical protein H310_03976 [Aphanomyces invadans]
MLVSSLKSREDACAALARSLVEDHDALTSDGETKTVCSSFARAQVELQSPHGASQLVMLWLHPSNLHLCFGKKKVFGSAVHGMHLAHLHAVRADDGPTSDVASSTPRTPPQFYLSFESFAGDVVTIAMPTQSARDNLLHTFQDILKVIDVMATVQDHVELYRRANKPSHHVDAACRELNQQHGMDGPIEDNWNNQVKLSPVKAQQLRQPAASEVPETAETAKRPHGPHAAPGSQPVVNQNADWTPADLDAWLHARQLSSLFVPLHAYLHDAYARGDAKAAFFRLTPDIVDCVVSNQNQATSSSTLLQLRQRLLQHIAKGRRTSSSLFPRRRSTFRLY